MTSTAPIIPMLANGRGTSLDLNSKELSHQCVHAQKQERPEDQGPFADRMQQVA
jgi:hypothetical protein